MGQYHFALRFRWEVGSGPAVLGPTRFGVGVVVDGQQRVDGCSARSRGYPGIIGTEKAGGC